ncbi:hypothetical protein LTR85_008644 [Meristemomyces frigidus]|nr:hypothetical protein LTR85_008644 [Meristemomyces frigidus]
MDDWQDAAFNHRRIPHGRSKKGGKAAGRKGAGAFDPKQAFGSYELKGSALETLLFKAEDKNAILEIHGLTEPPGGLVGSLVIGDKVKAAVLLAGSRKLLSAIVENAEAAEVDEASGEETGEAQTGSEEDDTEAETELEANDRKANERVMAFEKNSFRSPKFWLQWQGDVTAEEGEDVRERNQGYVVFSGNNCKDFQGTLSCKSLGWKDASVRGRKITTRARPAPYDWSEFASEYLSNEDEELDASVASQGYQEASGYELP